MLKKNFLEFIAHFSALLLACEYFGPGNYLNEIETRPNMPEPWYSLQHYSWGEKFGNNVQQFMTVSHTAFNIAAVQLFILKYVQEGEIIIV